MWERVHTCTTVIVKEGVFNLTPIDGLYQNTRSSRNCELCVFVTAHFSEESVPSFYQILKGISDTPKGKNYSPRG